MKKLAALIVILLSLNLLAGCTKPVQPQTSSVILSSSSQASQVVSENDSTANTMSLPQPEKVENGTLYTQTFRLHEFSSGKLETVSSGSEYIITIILPNELYLDNEFGFIMNQSDEQVGRIWDCVKLGEEETAESFLHHPEGYRNYIDYSEYIREDGKQVSLQIQQLSNDGYEYWYYYTVEVEEDILVYFWFWTVEYNPQADKPYFETIVNTVQGLGFA